MEDFTINEMQEMQRSLQEKLKKSYSEKYKKNLERW